MNKKSSVQSYQNDLHFEIWGNYYKLKLNEDKRYELYRVKDDEQKHKFNITFEANMYALEEARKYVLNHDTDIPEKVGYSIDEKNNSIKTYIWLFVFATILVFTFICGINLFY